MLGGLAVASSPADLGFHIHMRGPVELLYCMEHLLITEIRITSIDLKKILVDAAVFRNAVIN